ncbi:L,D-transpeptidase family protein [Geomobilimonas luticola]|uniref:L,D-transpeptidase family protein n=1 Tax=Geomobilimonas luticola TaxID=1114878 RepID=A0ABS5SBQ5_9BACT|nr:L,D-transpeptidase family protein [Geomobilimonas luticola]MBT0652036.1 L,D-transpeptidase family protein [Geomobilimonas luticola]
MYRTADLPLLANWRCFAALCTALVALNGCAAMRTVQEPGHPESEIKRNTFPVARGEDVVGRLAVIRLEEGDTLPDIARHFGLGVNAISAANPGVDLWVPEAGKRVTLPLRYILPDAPRKGIVINQATMRLFQFKGDGPSLVVSTYPVGVGTEERPTPMGQTRVARKAARPTWHVPASIAEDHRKKGDILPAKVPPGPENPLGEYALYLSKTGYLIHGTNKPASIGLRATNGCMRLYPENIEMLYRDTPVNTPVLIVNQPYLIGQRDGVLYLEAHTPFEGSGTGELEKIYAKLRSIEKQSAHTLDWKKVQEVQAEARGIPVPIFEMGQGGSQEDVKPLNVEHPDALYGRPALPELKLEAWYVLAADVREEIDARRLAAIINHQGPPIPARVLSKSSGYRVVAGPFNDVSAAREAARRLKIDLDIDGIVIEPVKQIENRKEVMGVEAKSFGNHHNKPNKKEELI